MRIAIQPQPTSLTILGFAVGLPLCGLLVLSHIPPLSALFWSSLVALTCVALASQLRATIQVGQDRIRIQYLLTSFADRLGNIEPQASEKFDFRTDERLGLKRLYLGTRLFGFYVGWYVLRDDSVAFVCVSRKHRARRLSTKDGHQLILDPGTAREVESYLTKQA